MKELEELTREIREEVCKCCEKDEMGNWIHEPCCNNGLCEAETTAETETLSWCKHCGGQMFKDNGCWFHHEQEEIPYKDRQPHLGI